MNIEKPSTILENEYDVITDDDSFLIFSPHSHESSSKIIDIFHNEMQSDEVPEWCDSCLCAQSCSFFNLMYFTYRATLYYVMVRSKEIKAELKQALGIDHPAFIFGITIPKNEWETNHLIRSGFTQLDNEKWVTSDRTFTVHGRVPMKTAVDLDILNVLGFDSSFLKYIPNTKSRVKTHHLASSSLVAHYKGGDLNLSTRPVDCSCLCECKKITGTLSLQFSDIETLPEGLCVDGDLLVQHTQLKKLPDNFKVGGKINISKTNITELPENFVANGSVLMMDCKVKSLPNNMKVKGNFNLQDSDVEYIPSDLYVEGSLNLKGTPFAAKLGRQDVTKLLPNVQNVIYV